MLAVPNHLLVFHMPKTVSRRRCAITSQTPQLNRVAQSSPTLLLMLPEWVYDVCSLSVIRILSWLLWPCKVALQWHRPPLGAWNKIPPTTVRKAVARHSARAAVPPGFSPLASQCPFHSASCKDANQLSWKERAVLPPAQLKSFLSTKFTPSATLLHASPRLWSVPPQHFPCYGWSPSSSFRIALSSSFGYLPSPE